MRRMYADLPITWNGVGEVAVSAVDDPPEYCRRIDVGVVHSGNDRPGDTLTLGVPSSLNFNGTAGSLKRTPRCPVHVNA